MVSRAIIEIYQAKEQDFSSIELGMQQIAMKQGVRTFVYHRLLGAKSSKTRLVKAALAFITVALGDFAARRRVKNRIFFGRSLLQGYCTAQFS